MFNDNFRIQGVTTITIRSGTNIFTKKFKKSQTVSFDTYLAIMLFMTTIVIFLAIIGSKMIDRDLDTDITGHRIKQNEIFGDQILTAQEEATIVTMTCSDFKLAFGESKNICLFLKDQDGNIIPLTNGTHVKYGVGCPGINISNVTCGENIT